MSMMDPADEWAEDVARNLAKLAPRIAEEASKPRCLETRTKAGVRWRRYRFPDGRVESTFELPSAVVSRLGRAKVLELCAVYAAQTPMRERRHVRRQRIEALLLAGTKPTAIAHELGTTDDYIRKVRADLRTAGRLPPATSGDPE